MPGAAATHGTHVPWHTRDVADVFAAMQTAASGLTDDEAARRLAAHGPNRLAPDRVIPWHVTALEQFRDPLIYVLLAAGAVTAIQRDLPDTVVIIVVVLLNAAIGFVQSRRAQTMVRSLAQLSTPRATVARSGRARDIDAGEIVPGDLVILSSGAHVPADVRLVEVNELLLDESLLTGESLPVTKTTAAIAEHGLVVPEQRNVGFAGTVVVRGRGRGIAIRTGQSTELGAIAHAIQRGGETRTPLQDALARFGRRVAIGVLGLAVFLVVIGLMRGMPATEIFLTAVAMAVSAVPEALPVVLTITLAVGVRRMARRRAIVRSLPAVETLGSTTVIGSDKTGTLTRNEMTVRTIWTAGDSYDAEESGYVRADAKFPAAGNPSPSNLPFVRTLEAAVFANEVDVVALARGESGGDPTEIALLVAAQKAGIQPPSLTQRHSQLDVLPFEADRGFMISRRDYDGGTDFIKGAPEIVLARCSKQLGVDGAIALDATGAAAAAANLAARGLRVLATAYRAARAEPLTADSDGDFVLCGFIGLEDPIRPEVPNAIRAARGAGIRVIMLTGDHLETARAVGTRLGLGDTAVAGQDLASLSDEELSEALKDTSVFARVAPEHKLRIVERLKAMNEIVAVTGDGVNDAPALRAAHLGIAMGRSGTDVARDSADIVLADDNFATITTAIEEGRAVFANIRRVTFFLLSSAGGEILAILTAILFGWPVPLTAIQILWINLVTDSAQAVALAFEPPEADLLHYRPRTRNAGVLAQPHFARLVAIGVLLGGITLMTFGWVLETTGDLTRARSMALTQMVILQLFHLFNCRSLDASAFRRMTANPFLMASIILTGVIHLMALVVPVFADVLGATPPSAREWTAMLAGGGVVLAAGEIDKWYNRRSGRRLG